MESLIFTLLEPFSYGYMSRAIFLSTVGGIFCAFLSCYLILKGMSLFAEALAHSVIPGVAVSFILKISYFYGALVAVILATLSMMGISKYSNIKQDAVIALVLSSFFAAGLLLQSIFPTSVRLDQVIFGEILAISEKKVYYFVMIALISLLGMVIFRKTLTLIFFDEVFARSIGIKVGLYKSIFFFMLAICILTAMQTVGALLVVAIVIIPGASAFLISKQIEKIFLIAIAFGGTTGFLGSYLSFFIDSSTGAQIVFFQSSIFAVCYLINYRRSHRSASQAKVA